MNREKWVPIGEKCNFKGEKVDPKSWIVNAWSSHFFLITVVAIIETKSTPYSECFCYIRYGKPEALTIVVSRFTKSPFSPFTFDFSLEALLIHESVLLNRNRPIAVSRHTLHVSFYSVILLFFRFISLWVGIVLKQQLLYFIKSPVSSRADVSIEKASLQNEAL